VKSPPRLPFQPLQISFSSSSSQQAERRSLVLASSRLASLELLQVPPADLHVAALLVHAPRELLRRAGAVVAPRLVVGVAAAVGLDVVLGRGLGGEGLVGGAAAEEAGDGVADGGAYRDTTGKDKG